MNHIVCAAIRLEGSIITGARHFDKIMIEQIKTDGRSWASSDQGFIDQYCNFYNREEAMDIVIKNKQKFCKDRNGSGKILFSEGLY